MNHRQSFPDPSQSVGADHAQTQLEIIRTLKEIIDKQDRIIDLQNEKIGILISHIDMLCHYMQEGTQIPLIKFN